MDEVVQAKNDVEVQGLHQNCGEATESWKLGGRQPIITPRLITKRHLN